MCFTEVICYYRKGKTHTEETKMKEIKAFEEARNNKDSKVNRTVFWAYEAAKEAGNDLLDFNEVIWEQDIPEILNTCKEHGISEFTISSTFSSLIATLAEFEKLGCHMAGLTEVNARYTDYRTGEKQIIPAIKMSL
nr:MAG TPA: hypothetical protein [Caudoviricetes sp.]